MGERMQNNLMKIIRFGVCMLGLLGLGLLAGCSEKKDPMEKITYQDNGFMYICVGYGEQVSGGYSIAVNALYLTENAIYADTTLLGPDPSDPAAGKKNSVSCPYIVLKTEFIDKPVVFD